MAITLKQRAYAGLWFMAAGVIPVLFAGKALFPLPPRQTFDFVVWFMLAPLLVTGLLGALLGAAILDPHIVSSGWRAALRGLIIAAAPNNARQFNLKEFPVCLQRGFLISPERA